MPSPRSSLHRWSWGATLVLAPSATATPALGTCAVNTGSNLTRALSLNDVGFLQPRARIKPRAGDGPLQVTEKEGIEPYSVVMRVPLDVGGRLVVELTTDEAGALSEQLRNPVNDSEVTQSLSVRAGIRPRTGDGPLEVTEEGQSMVMRLPLEGGGRLVVELTPDEVGALADKLDSVVG
ncbi:hypothetical protein GCM10020295_01030 [Streptomyces cinereospinus]